jgi:zinc-ribbon domain
LTEHARCPRCRHENAPENRFCGWCGAPLASNELVPLEGRNLAAAGRALPARLGPTGRALVVGLVAVAAEASLAWLRRRTVAGGDVGSSALEHLIVQSSEEVYVRTRMGTSQDGVFTQRAVRAIVSKELTDSRRS